MMTTSESHARRRPKQCSPPPPPHCSTYSPPSSWKMGRNAACRLPPTLTGKNHHVCLCVVFAPSTHTITTIYHSPHITTGCVWCGDPSNAVVCVWRERGGGEGGGRRGSLRGKHLRERGRERRGRRRKRVVCGSYSTHACPASERQQQQHGKNTCMRVCVQWALLMCNQQGAFPMCVWAPVHHHLLHRHYSSMPCV